MNTEQLSLDAASLIPPAPLTEQSAIPPVREQLLRQLLDGPYGTDHYGNYEYARDSGLIDIFYYDPISGHDGLVHSLSGNTVRGANGAEVVQGFHHEPSGGYGSLNLPPSTVERDHLNGADAHDFTEYKENPFEPYRARVAIAGLQKYTTRINIDNGQTELVRTKNGMFPKEYDALMVLQAVRIARDKRDRTKDVISDRNGMLVTEGSAPMIDNESPLRIRLILDPKTEKVISAIPIVKPKGAMKLTEADIQHYIFGEGASEKVVKLP